MLKYDHDWKYTILAESIGSWLKEYDHNRWVYDPSWKKTIIWWKYTIFYFKKVGLDAIHGRLSLQLWYRQAALNMQPIKLYCMYTSPFCFCWIKAFINGKRFSILRDFDYQIERMKLYDHYSVKYSIFGERNESKVPPRDRLVSGKWS